MNALVLSSLLAAPNAAAMSLGHPLFSPSNLTSSSALVNPFTSSNNLSRQPASINDASIDPLPAILAGLLLPSVVSNSWNGSDSASKDADTIIQRERELLDDIDVPLLNSTAENDFGSYGTSLVGNNSSTKHAAAPAGFVNCFANLTEVLLTYFATAMKTAEASAAAQGAYNIQSPLHGMGSTCRP
jgi:hypothetical protein